jgi:hypothetical protein
MQHAVEVPDEQLQEGRDATIGSASRIEPPNTPAPSVPRRSVPGRDGDDEHPGRQQRREHRVHERVDRGVVEEDVEDVRQPRRGRACMS